MGFKHYNRILYIYLTFLIILSAFVGWLVAEKLFTYAIIALFALVLIVRSLLVYMNKTNRQIQLFISAVKNNDTTLRFPPKTGNKVINELHESLNELNVVLQQTKVQSQIKEQYFSEIIKNVGIGVMVVNEKGFITEVNPSALEIFGVHTLTHIAQFERIDAEFKRQLEEAKGPKQLLVLKRKHEQVQLILRCSVLQLKNENVRLLTLQDIRGELERKEIDSWVKLIRVLSHEIMNSLTPVTSITQSLKSIWKEKMSNDEIDEETIESTISGLDVIGERGEALIRFVQSYRILTRVPQPMLEQQSVDALFSSLNILLSPFREENNVEIVLDNPPSDFIVFIDIQMITQVIINLVKNAVEAHSKSILLRVKQEKNNVIFQVIDDGEGISQEVVDNIFVPFFTTKDKGSGIGLSHSKQIVKAHGGSLKCESKPGKTIFEVVL